MRKFYEVLKENSNFRKMVLADTINTIGDVFDSFALSFFVYELTGSKYWFALNFAINALPNLIIQPFMGVLIERLPKKFVMIVSDLGRAGLVMTLIVLNSLVNLSPWIVLLFTFLMTCMEAFRQPASGSILPQLLAREDYDYGISTKSTLSLIVSIGTNALVGIVIARFGIMTAMIVDAISFVLSAGVISTMQLEETVRSVENTYFIQLKEGWKYFINSQFIFYTSIMMFVVQLFLMGFNVVLIPYFGEVLLKGPEYVSFFTTLQLVGQVLSTIAYPKIHERFENKELIGTGGVLLSISMIALSLLKNAAYQVLAMGTTALLLGMGAGLFMIALRTAFYECVEEDVLARVSALSNSFTYAAIPLGSFLTSAMMVLTSMEIILLSYGIILLSVFVIFLRTKKVRE